MTKAMIHSVSQTEKAGLFTIIFEGESNTEFVKFVEKFKDDAERKDDLTFILNQIQEMMNKNGFLERRFRPEGKINDNVMALPIYRNSLRLYCLRLSDSVLIVGNGGVKHTQKVSEDEILNGYVISLQKLDALLQADIKSGAVRIEQTKIIGTDEKDYDI